MNKKVRVELEREGLELASEMLVQSKVAGKLARKIEKLAEEALELVVIGYNPEKLAWVTLDLEEKLRNLNGWMESVDSSAQKLARKAGALALEAEKMDAEELAADIQKKLDEACSLLELDHSLNLKE